MVKNLLSFINAIALAVLYIVVLLLLTGYEIGGIIKYIGIIALITGIVIEIIYIYGGLIKK